MNAGGRMLKRPAMLSPMARKIMATTDTTIGFWKERPTREPVKAAATPRIE